VSARAWVAHFAVVLLQPIVFGACRAFTAILALLRVCRSPLCVCRALLCECRTLQPTATHCTHCNTLHHIATHCTTLQHTAPHCNTLHDIRVVLLQPIAFGVSFLHSQISIDDQVLLVALPRSVEKQTNQIEIGA